MVTTENDSKWNWKYLFSPDSIAVIGASNTPGSWGYNITKGLLVSGERRIYPVNPSSREIFGLKAYESILDIPGPVELAVVVVAERLVPGVLQECVSKAVKSAVIITSGFGEMGKEGRKIEARLAEIAHTGEIKFVGPNSMGHADANLKLSTFGEIGLVPAGPVAVLSQSGSMCLSIVHDLVDSGIGCSKFVSTGNEASLYMEDYLEYLAGDEDTEIIAAYIEGLRDGRRFLRLAREITALKPIVAIKVGGTEGSAKAVMSHTGALAGTDAVYTAAFRQTGVIRVEDNDELCDVVQALGVCTLPGNNRAGIISMGGGQGALTAEACEKEGLSIAKLAQSTISRLDGYLSSRWPRRNPVDMAGPAVADFSVIMNLISALIEDPNVDMIFLLAPIIMPEDILVRSMGLGPDEIKAFRDKEAKEIGLISRKAEEFGKPVVMISHFREMIDDPEIATILRKGKILVHTNSGQAARVMAHLVRYKRYLDTRTKKSATF